MKLIIELKDETYKFYKENALILIARGNGRILASEVYEAIKNGKPYDEAEVWRKSNELLEKRLAYLGNPKDRWISVKDKLPEEYGNYLVFTDDSDIDIGVYHPRYIVPQWSMCDAEGFYWADDKDIKVLAWKPLPEAYEPKGGTE